MVLRCNHTNHLLLFSFPDHIWQTDLDWLIPRQDRLLVLQFFTGGSISISSTTTQAPYYHPAAQIREFLEDQDTWWPCSPEFLNLCTALVVYAVRYAAVFWNTNKAFGLIFSLQQMVSILQVMDPCVIRVVTAPHSQLGFLNSSSSSSTFAAYP